MLAGEVDKLIAHLDGRASDAIVSCLGLSVIPAWETALDALLTALKPGGQLLVMDVVAKKRTMSTW